jgi:hypothetical protein
MEIPWWVWVTGGCVVAPPIYVLLIVLFSYIPGLREVAVWMWCPFCRATTCSQDDTYAPPEEEHTSSEDAYTPNNDRFAPH